MGIKIIIKTHSQKYRGKYDEEAAKVRVRTTKLYIEMKSRLCTLRKIYTFFLL